MNHRLFHTLVLGSGLLLEGCGAVHVNTADGSTGGDDSGTIARDAAVVQTDAAIVQNDAAIVQNDAATPSVDAANIVDAAVAEYQTCADPGWPPTKGVHSFLTQTNEPTRIVWCWIPDRRVDCAMPPDANDESRYCAFIGTGECCATPTPDAGVQAGT